MACADACECDRTPFPPRPGFTQFAADNADRNLTTLDGKNTFHGIGMLTVTTNKEKHNSQIFRSFENLIVKTFRKKGGSDFFHKKGGVGKIGRGYFKNGGIIFFPTN